MDRDAQVLILGIGNVLWADEGFGVRAVEALHQRYRFPANVTLMDGGTQGLNLLQHVQATDVLIIFDAVDFGLPPGSLKLARDDKVPRYMGSKKMSMHQSGFQEVLASAQLLGRIPDRMLLVGAQPVDIKDYGGSLSPEVRAQIEPAVQAALAYLEGIGIVAATRSAPLAEDEVLMQSSLDIDGYESGRPAAEEACRFGDARVLFAAGVRR